MKCPYCDQLHQATASYMDNEFHPYCNRNCFDAHVNEALDKDATHCKIHNRVTALRDDAETRVKNIETFGSNKLVKTREYYQARADVLNDLLMVMDPDSRCSCL